MAQRSDKPITSFMIVVIKNESFFISLPITGIGLEYQVETK